MNIKSLLIGSAAALAAVSGAQAADAIVAAEPEPMEYVRVCDAFGTGFFYIPGTETCLKVGGFARFQVGISRDERGRFQAAGGENSDWDAFSLVDINFDARNDTEFGQLRSYINIEARADRGAGDFDFVIDEAYIQIAGFKVGYFYSWWDEGIAGETDGLGNQTLFNSIAYTYDGGAWKAGLSIDELEETVGATPSNGIGVAGTVGFKLGGVQLDVLGGYDTEMEEGAIRAILKADVGPGTFALAGVWASGVGAYWNDSEWSVAASYAFKATEKLTITPAFQYFGDVNFNGAGSPDAWRVGLTAGYDIVPGTGPDNIGRLQALATVEYEDSDLGRDFVNGFLRLQRNF